MIIKIEVSPDDMKKYVRELYNGQLVLDLPTAHWEHPCSPTDKTCPKFGKQKEKNVVYVCKKEEAVFDSKDFGNFKIISIEGK